MKKILLVEDNIALCELISLHLENSGFQVGITNSLKETKVLNLSDFNLVILDLDLPDGNGKELIPSFLNNRIPIIILTANNSLTEKVKGLNLGADDYISKPFEALELIARINALLRRSNEVDDFYIIEETKINIKDRKAFWRDLEIELTYKEWELLLYFINNKNQILSRDQILNSVWGYDYFGVTRTVDVHIKQLRKKLNISSIKTVYKQGYRLNI